jgi:hypothetical protein
LDDRSCPDCGVSKAEWTISIGKTRTFVLSGVRKREKTFLEIELVDAEGEALAGAKYRAQLPSGLTKKGTLDDQGRARFEKIPPGVCKVSFPDQPDVVVIRSEPEGLEALAEATPSKKAGVRVRAGALHVFGPEVVTASKHWIEFSLLDAADKPRAGVAYRVEFEDGTLAREGHLNEDGWAREDEFEKDGFCRVVFPELRIQGEVELVAVDP